ncbi:MAG: hypothetical protein KBT46_07465 [Ruminococcus sp.]|nr:hypothetical protein [Candidatus Copronaster equi]
MKIEYSIAENILKTEDLPLMKTYGIVAKDSTSGSVLDEFADVSIQQVFTENIINILNKNEVELCHFRDVIEDELNR